MSSYNDLRAWREAIDLVEAVYRSTTSFPSAELYGLTTQMRRAAISIPSNIAEGQGRMTNGEWLQFLGHARGSLYELQTQIVIATRLALLSSEKTEELTKLATQAGQSLAGLINYVRRLN